jgi:GNAT superfamily N-acetyltransferase
MDVEVTTAIRQADVGAAKTMLDRTAEQFDVTPSRLVADGGYGSAEMVGWLVDDRGIEPLTSTAEDRETVIGEARVALSCAKRAGEFSMSIADDWRRLGLGSALLREIERKAAADGIELLFGDTLRTNEAMIGLALGRGFRFEPGLEARLVRIRKRLDDAAPDLPCQKWSEIARGAELGMA